MRTQDVADYIGENSDVAKEIAKKAFKACWQGKIPVALAAVGVSTITGIVAAELVDEAAIPDSIIDNIIDLF